MPKTASADATALQKLGLILAAAGIILLAGLVGWHALEGSAE